MMPRHRLVLRMLIIWGLCLCGVMPSAGYVLSGEHVIDRMTVAMGDAGGFSVTHTTVAGEAECPRAKKAGAGETSWYDPPGRFRFEAVSGKTKRIYVSGPDGALTIVDDRIVSTAESDLMRYKEPLLCRDREALVNRLVSMGIDPTVSSLGRLDSAVAYVVGARYPDASVPQLWVNKETFLPFRLLIRHPDDKTLMEARYSEWRKGEGLRFPMRIGIYRDGRLIRTICSHVVGEKSSFEEGFFDITALQSRYPAADTSRKEQPPESGTDEIQQAIENFKKLYE